MENKNQEDETNKNTNGAENKLLKSKINKNIINIFS